MQREKNLGYRSVQGKQGEEVDKPVFPGLTTWSCIGVVAKGTVLRSNGAV